MAKKNAKKSVAARSLNASWNKSEERKAYEERVKTIADRFAVSSVVRLSSKADTSNDGKAFTSLDEYLECVMGGRDIVDFGNSTFNTYDAMRAKATEHLVEIRCGNSLDFITNKEEIYRHLSILGDDDLDCTLGYIDPMGPASKYVDYITIFKKTDRGVEHLITMNKKATTEVGYGNADEAKREFNKRSLFILKDGRYNLRTMDVRGTIGITAANILHDKKIA